MLLKYYKGSMPLYELNKLTNTNNNGTTAYHLIEAGKKIGFDSKGYKCPIEDLESKVNMPCIAHVTLNDSYEHYVVIYKINKKKKKIIIGDPADKVKTISYEEFLNIWSNIILTFTPKNIYTIPHKKNSFIKFIYEMCFNYKKSMLNIIMLSFIITVFSIALSFFFEFMVSTLSITNSKNNLLLILIVFLVLYLFKNITTLFRNKILIQVNKNIDYELTTTIFKKIISLPYHYYRNHTTGDLISRINDLSLIKNLISKIIVTVFVDLILTVVSLIVLYLINSKLFLLSIIIYCLYGILIFIFKPLYNKYILDIQNNKSKTMSYMIESITSFETVKGINIENEIIDNFEEKYNNLLKVNKKFENCYSYQLFFKETINNLGFLFIIFCGFLLVIDGKMSIGEVLTFNSLLCYFLEPIRNIVDLNTDIGQAKTSLNRINEVIVKENSKGLISKKIHGNIEYKNLSYTYDSMHYILKNINLKIKKGNKVMVLGKSGSGKSTLLKLIMKYYDCDRGQLLIDNLDINDYDASCISKNICYVSQNEILYTDSVYNNINLNRKIDINRFLEIEKMCYVEDILKNNRLGFNMILEENGFNISGGEKQRIILARSLLKKFNILILDEALNQVDIDLERKILKNIFDKYKNKTIIIISHRLANMDLFDQVVELADAEIIKDVTKNE